MERLLSETVNHKLSAERIIFMGPDPRLPEFGVNLVGRRQEPY